MQLLSLSPAFIHSCHALGKPGQVENKSDSLKLGGSLTPFLLLKRQLPPFLPSRELPKVTTASGRQKEHRTGQKSAPRIRGGGFLQSLAPVKRTWKEEIQGL